MCKPLLNIVPNIYNRLQSSFLSLVWPWSGRSLPKGNQWECWDPGLGPNVVGPQFTPIHPWHPYTLTDPHMPSASPWCPYTPAGSLMPQFPAHPCWPPIPPETPYPCWPSESLTFSASPNVPLTPLHPYCSPDTPTPLPVGVLGPGLGPNVVRLPVHLPPLNAPCTPTPPAGTPDAPYTPAGPNTPWHPLTAY